jgi:ubiquinone/menaquinone biosynthesis C-methylase UbiE
MMHSTLPADSDTPTDRLYHDAELAQFYDLDNGWGSDLAYCRTLAATARSVLDLGCGTGQFAAALAQERGAGIEITAVDPAAAMLDIARRRPGGDGVTWIEADARQVRLDRQVDLVLLTGHAFQVFLTAEDRLAVLRTIAAHLAPGGRFIFDSRNPVVEEWRSWLPDQTQRRLTHPRLGSVEAWNDSTYDAATGTVTYQTCYRCAGDGTLFSAQSRIAFPDKDSIAALIDATGLSVDRWLGSWHGEIWHTKAPEIIPIGAGVRR